MRAVAVGALPDGTPVIISGSGDGTVRVWRTADGTPVGEPLTGHDRRGERGGGRGAAGRHPGHRQRRRRRHGAGVAAGRRHPGRGAADRPRPAGCRRWRWGHCRTAPRSSSAAAAAVRVWRLADGTPAGEWLTGHDRLGVGGGGGGTAGRHPGHNRRRRRRPRRHGGGVAAADGTPARLRCAATTAGCTAVAAGALPDGTPVIVSGGDDGTVRVWRTADGTPAGEPLTGHTGGCRRWRSGRCRTAPRSSSAAATTARCGCGGWPTAPRSGSR